MKHKFTYPTLLTVWHRLRRDDFATLHVFLVDAGRAEVGAAAVTLVRPADLVLGEQVIRQQSLRQIDARTQVARQYL